MVKQLRFLLIFLLVSVGGVWGQLNADFITIPSYNNNNSISVCQGSTILFVLEDQNNTNITPTTQVTWAFTGATISSSTMRTPFPVTFNSTGTATLTLTDGALTSSFQISVNAGSSPPISPTLSCASPTSATTTTALDGTTKFTYCPNPESGNHPFLFSLSSTLTCPANISAANSVGLSVLGNNTTNPPSCPVSSITRSFAQGFYYLVFRIQFNNGCLYTKVYYLEIGKPGISLNTAATTACDPGNYALSFNDQSPGVQYTVYWDYINNPTIVNQYTYPNFPIFPQTVNHNYPFAPCTGSPSVAPTRQIKIKAVNSCGETFPSPATISVNQKPESGFTISTPTTICQGTSVTFTDTSYSGVYIEASNQCSPVHKREWNFNPTIVAPNSISGTLGNYLMNTSGSSTLNVTFNTPGTYQIRLIAFNNSCDPDTSTKTICVVPAVQANFNTNVTSGCAPVAISTTNNSSLPGCTGTSMLYNWSVSNAAATCGNPAWNYTNNTNSNSSAPQFNFTGPGLYTIRLVTSLNPVVAGTQCQNDTITQTITVKEKPIISLATPSAICEDQSFIPQATVNNCYTTSPTYAWSFSNGTPLTSSILNPGSILYPNSGNFTFSLSATNDCGTITQSNTITVNQLAIVDAGNYSVTCSGNSIQLSGSVTGGATGGTWTSGSGGVFQPNPNTLNATFTPPVGSSGSVSLTLTANGIISPCPAVNDIANISLNAAPFVNAGNDTSICAGSSVILHGTIGGAATSGTWSTMGSGTFQSVSSLNTTYTPSAADITAGNVKLILTTNDPAGPCSSAKDTLNVIIKPIPLLTIGTASAVCSGVAFSVPLTPSILSPPASYNWTLSGTLPAGVTTATSGSIAAPNNTFTGTVQNLSTGPVTLQYQLTTTVNGCTSINTPASVTINPLPQPVITPPGPTTVCNGSTLTLSTSVFSTYLWSNNATTQSTVISTAGNYTVTVTNSYGCTGSSAASIVNFSVPITPNFNQVAPICSNGTFSLPITSTNGITGTWSPAINNLATTTYTFTPSSGQCANTTPMIVTVNPLPNPMITANGPTTFCQGSSVVLTGTGGGTYVWNLNGTAIANATTASLTATQAGSYSVTVTNANGCTATSTGVTVAINPNPQPLISPISPATICTGASMIISTSSTFSNYAWYLGSSTSSLGSNDSLQITTAGSYTVSVTNSNGCTGLSTPFVLQTTAPITPTFTTISPICAGGTFTLQNTSLNGITGFWSPAPNFTTTTVYTFTPLSGSCANTTTMNIVVKPQPTVLANGVTICSGSSITLNATPSLSGGTFSWSNGPTTQSNLVSPITNTTYTVNYTLNGCIASDTAQVVVIQTPSIVMSPATICAGQSTTISPVVSPTGGVFQWNTNATTASISVSPTTNTTYSLTYSVNGCQASQSSALITVNPVPTVTTTSSSICAGQSALINATVSPTGGTYLWSTNQTTPSISVSPATTTTYNLVYTVNGCASTPTNATINVTPLPVVSAPNYTICSGQSTTLNTTVNTPGGTYVWSPNTALSSNSVANPVASPNNTQIYTVTYTVNGCTSLPDSVVVSVIQSIQASVNSPVICNGASTTLTASPANANYLWSNGATTQSITLSPTNSQALTVTVSAAGCPSSNATANVTVNPIPSVSVANVSAICNGSSATLTATPSAPNGTYLWSSGQTTNTISVSPALTSPTTAQNFNYSVVYTLNGCPSTAAAVVVTVNPVPTVSLPTTTTICNGSGDTIVATVNLTGGTYLWSNNATTSQIIVNPTTNTNYSVSYSLNGCSATSASTTGNVVVNPIPTVSVNNPTICAGQQATLTAVGSPANQGTYLWSTGATTASISINPTASSTYSVTYTVNNCPSVAGIANVTVNPIPTLDVANVSICGGLPVTLTANPTPSGGTYLWSANAGSATTNQVTLTPTATTTYSVAYTANGCTANDNVTVTVIQNPIAALSNQTICFGQSATLVASPNGANYSWSTGATTQSITVSPTVTSTYTVTVNIGGCAATSATAQVTVNPIPSVSVANVSAICNGSSATLTATPSAPNGTYLWSSGQASNTISVSPALTSPTTAQNFNYSVVYTLNGCPSLADTVTVAVNPVPTVSLPTTTTICNGSGDTLVATVNLPGGAYLWSNNATTSQIIVNPTTNTNYSVSYSLNGCSATSASTTGNVVVNPIPTVSVTGPVSICAGQQATLTATPSAAGGSYLWSNGATSASINVNPTTTTTYSVVYTLNGCASAPLDKQVPVNPIPTLDVANVSICGGLPVTLTANPTPSGGTYLWSANAGSATTNQVTLTPTATTTYSVAYTANGCTANDNVTVTFIQNPIAALSNQTICFGQSATLVASPNGANYSWSTGATTQSITVSPTVTSTYTVTVNIGGCAATSATATVTVNPIPSVSVANVNAICNGSSTTLTATPSAPNGTYLWSNGQTSNTISVSPALTSPTTAQNFNYSVVYTLNGCPSLADTVAVAVNPVPTVSLPTTTTICNGSGDTLVATVNLTGGTYLWSNNATTSQIIVNPTANTNYSVSYSLNGCSATSASTTGNVVVNPIPTVSVNNPTICAGQQATLTAVGSPANQGTYLWSTGATTASISINPTASSTYSVTYTVNNCPSVAGIANVTVNPIPTLDVADVSICGGLPVTLTANPTPSGGTYLWSANAGSATTNQVTLTPTATTTYSVAYTANGCTANDNVTVTFIQNPIAALSNQTICFGQSATLVASPNGANYSWSTGATTQSITVSPTVTSTYTVTVNIGGCAATSATAQVTVNPIPSVSVANVSAICNGSSATLTATPSAPNGTYLWSSGQTSNTISVSPPLTSPTTAQNFNYSVVYTLNGCPSLADTVAVAVNPVPTVSLPTTTTICNGSGDTLVATVNLTGGTYSWSNGLTTPSIIVNPVSNTNYSVSYSLNGCNATSASTTGNVVVNPIPTVSVTGPVSICAGQQATLTATPSAAGGSYLWSNGATSASINVNPTTTTTYSVVYTLNGCASAPFDKQVPVNPIPTITINDTTICGGLSVLLSPAVTPSGGTFLWSANTSNATTSQVTVSPATTTTYTLAYTANGCVGTENIQVSVIQNPIAALSNQVICFGQSATLVASPNGANYSWSTGATTQSITVSPTVTSTYTVTVNIGGCAATSATAQVTVNPIPSVSVANVSAICNGSSTTLTATPSAPNGTYLWSSGQTTNTISVSPALTSPTTAQNFNYSVVYTLNGCPSLADTVAVAVNPVPTVSLPTTTTICNGSGDTLVATVNLTGGTYLWSNNATTSQIIVNPTANTNYSVSYSLNGCSATSASTTGNVVVNPIPTVSVTGPVSICAGQQAILTATPSAPGGSYLWSNGATSASINVNPTTTTTYSVVYTLNGCASAPFDKQVPVNPIPTITINDTTICGGLSVLLSPAVSPSGGTFLWSANASNATTSQVTVNPATTTSYTLAYTANGCVGTENIQVSVIQNPIAALSNQVICFGQSATLVASPNGANYSWSTGATTQSITVNPTVTSTYTVTVNIGGCAATSATAQVTVNPIPSVSVANVSAICNGSSTTLTATPSAPNGTYLWSNGQTTNTISVSPPLTSPTTAQNFNYSVVYTLNGCPSLADTVAVAVNPVPTVSLPTTTTICNGSGDTLVATVNLTGGTYSWSNGLTTPSIIVNPVSNTNYSVSYSLNGCSATSASTTGNVVVNPIPTVSVTGPLSICAGQQATLTATPSAAGGSYLWSNGATSASINVNPTTTTTYSVVYTLNGCASAPFDKQVPVNPIPTITINDTTICGGLSVLLSPAVTPSGGTFLWSANANAATTSQVTVNPATTTTYTLAYTANGCVGTENIQVSVIQNPIAALSNQVICFGQSATLVASPNGANYSWSTGATTQSITVSPTVTSTYTVTVNIGGCAATSATAQVTVNPIPSVSVANVSAICNGSSATLTATPSAPNGTYLWSSGQTSNTISVSPPLTSPTTAQNFNYSVVYTLNGCPSLADTLAVAVNPVPTVSFNDTTICEGTSATLVGTPNILGGAYLWSNGANTQQINVSPSVTTNYTLIYNLNGCGDTISEFVYVNPLPSAQINQNPTICYGSATTLTSSVSPANGTYEWSGFGLSGVNNQNQVTVSPQNGNSTQNASHIYELVYTLNGCTDTAFTTVNVNLIPSVLGLASEDTICPGQNIQLSATGTPTISNGNSGAYSWSTANPISSIGNSAIVSVSPITNTTYEVVYTMNGCNSPAYPVAITIQTAPQITIQNNPNATICEGGCVTLTAVPAASTITPSGYSWSTGETTQSIQVCPTDTAQYTVIGLSGTCQSPVATTTVNVTGDPVISSNLMADTSMCVGGSFTFNLATSGGVGTPSYTWYLNNQPNNYSGAALPNSNNASYSTPTIVQPTTQYYYAQVTYPGVGCNQLTSDLAQLNVVADPIVALDPVFNQTLCEGGTATCIVPIVTGGVGSNTYLWLPTMSADEIFCPPSDQIGTQNYNVIVQQSGIGCGSIPSNTIAITVVADPTIQIVGTANVCEGAEVPLITTVQGGLGTISSYQWSSSYPNGNPYININGANAFNYTTFILEDQVGIAVNMAQSVEGCNASDTFLINVFEDPQVSIIGDSLTCMGLVNNLQTLVTGGVPNSTNTFTWFSPGTEQNPTPYVVQSASQQSTYDGTISSDTSYFVSVDNSGFGCDNDTSAVFEVGVVQWAVANFDIDPEIPSQSILNPTFSFINTSENSTSYLWDLGECDPQLPYSELYTSPTLSYNPNSVDQINYTYGCSPGYYSVTLYAYNQGMCPDTVTQIIRIRDEVIVYVPNAFTPGEVNNTNEYFYPVITGKIQPNTYRFTIYNRWGEVIFETKDPNEKWDGYRIRPYSKNEPGYDNLARSKAFAQDGVYIWQLEFVAEESKVIITKQGHVTLLGENY